MDDSLRLIAQQLEWLKYRMTPDMQRRLEKKQEKPTYVCHFCGSVFQKGCALGGHISKKHSSLKKVRFGRKHADAAERIEQEPLSTNIISQIAGEELLESIANCDRTVAVKHDERHQN
jgi:transcription initiation factor IIE alpha subunit